MSAGGECLVSRPGHYDSYDITIRANSVSCQDRIITDDLPILLFTGDIGCCYDCHYSSPVSGPGYIYLYYSGMLRSEEHTSELQSRPHLVCRLLLEKKKTPNPN